MAEYPSKGSVTTAATPTSFDRSIGVPGATFAIVGFVVGGSILVLPGELASHAGPAVILAYLAASIMILFVCLMSVQMSNVFPITGAGYVSISRVLSPFMGFLVLWMSIPLVGLGLSPLLFGISDYAAAVFPSLEDRRQEIAWASLLAIYLLNLAGVKTTIRVQTIMVAAFMVVLILFGGFALVHVEPSNYQPFAPNGGTAVAAATVAAFYSYTGFSMITSLGGEIKQPRRNIPLAMGISYFIVLLMYLLITFAVTGVMAWDNPEIQRAPVIKISQMIMPEFFIAVVSSAALLAIFTSINAGLLAASRELFRLAKARVLPKPFDYISEKNHEPVGAITLLTLLIAASLSLDFSFSKYATLAVVLAMLPQILTAISVMAIPYRVPDLYDKAEIRLPVITNLIVGLIVIALSCGMIFVGIESSGVPWFVFLSYISFGGICYGLRYLYLRRIGINIKELLLVDTAELEEVS